jgi:hypothetical protein
MSVSPDHTSIQAIADVGVQHQRTAALVTEKFDAAMDKADEAWETAISFIEQLGSLAATPVIQDVDVEFNYTPVAITNNLQSRRPEPPTDEEMTVTIPTAPVMQGTFRNMDLLEYNTALMNEIKEGLLGRINTELVEGSTGLNETVEEAIWQRARSRQELENIQKYYEAENYYAARGFDLPPGALAGRMNELLVEQARNDSYLNNDVMVEQARLAQANSQFILREGAGIISQFEQNYIQSVLSYNKNLLDLFLADTEVWKGQVSVEITRVETILKVYLGEIDAYKADVSAAVADIELQGKVVELTVRQELAKAEIALKKIQMQIEIAKIQYGLQSDSLKAGAQVIAQLAAGALSAVNASASMSMAGSVSEAVGTSVTEYYDRTKGVMGLATQHNYNISSNA